MFLWKSYLLHNATNMNGLWSNDRSPFKLDTLCSNVFDDKFNALDDKCILWGELYCKILFLFLISSDNAIRYGYFSSNEHYTFACALLAFNFFSETFWSCI